MKMNLTTKMVACFLLVVLVAMVGFAYTIYKVNDVVAAVTEVGQEMLPRLLKTTEANNNASDQIGDLRGYFITKDPQLLADYQKKANANRTIIEELRQTAVSEEGRRVAAEVKALDDQYTTIAEAKFLPLVQADKLDEAVAVMRTEMAPTAKDLNAKFDEYQALRNRQITNSLNQAAENANTARLVGIIAALLAALLGSVIGFFTARSIAQPVNQMAVVARKVAGGDLTEQITVKRQDEIGKLAADFNTMTLQLKTLIRQINANAEQLAASSEELTANSEQSAQAANQIATSITSVASGANEQMAAADESAAIVEQMSAGIQQIAANTNQVSEQSAQATEKAKAGGQEVEKAVAQMSKIETTVNHSAEVVVKLGERSKEIGQIVDAISGIAGQTNLLALNAAIEAARAGEQGRGFAVVAEEVRKLAEQSQEAAKKIAELIGEIQGETANAVAAMDEGTREVKNGAEAVNAAGVSFREIVVLISQVSGQVREISAAIQQMAGGSQQIVDTVKKMDMLSKTSSDEAHNVSAATEEQLASMEEVATSSQALAQLAQDLQMAVATFRV